VWVEGCSTGVLLASRIDLPPLLSTRIRNAEHDTVALDKKNMTPTPMRKDRKRRCRNRDALRTAAHSSSLKQAVAGFETYGVDYLQLSPAPSSRSRLLGPAPDPVGLVGAVGKRTRSIMLLVRLV
jgi:hypothetical protein